MPGCRSQSLTAPCDQSSSLPRDTYAPAMPNEERTAQVAPDGSDGADTKREEQSNVDWVGWLRRWDLQQEGYVPEREARFVAMFDVLAELHRGRSRGAGVAGRAGYDASGRGT